jgi:salicylate hydroxylase
MLQVIISGAGITGLAAAISCRRAGHTVHIYERSSMANEVGAAINVPPNASRFLIPWGLDPVKWRFVPNRKFNIMSPVTMENIALIQTGEVIKRASGSGLYYAHRVDLHNALKWMATRPDGPGTPVTIHLSSEVVSFDPFDPSITLASGEKVPGDVVIGADGVHSIASEAVLGHKNVMIPPVHYNCAYRFLIPAETLEADPETRFFNEDMEGWMRLFTLEATSRRLIAYTCRDSTIHNFVGLVYDNEMNSGEKEDWHASVGIDVVLDRFSDFDPRLLKVISKAKEVKRWPLLYRSPIETWHKGRLVLAGDAAHPMLPHMAQGGAQGMEDGFALGVVLHGAKTAADVKARLAIYQSVRRLRASVIQVLSNVGQDETNLVKNDLMEFLKEDEIPKTPADSIKFNMGYDIVRSTVEAMKKLDPDFELPKDFFETDISGPNGEMYDALAL